MEGEANMSNMSISLPEPLKLFVEEQVSKGGYRTASEYLGELIREAQRRTIGASSRRSSRQDYKVQQVK